MKHHHSPNKYSLAILNLSSRVKDLARSHQRNISIVAALGVCGVLGLGVFEFLAYQRKERVNHLYFQAAMQSSEYFENRNTTTDPIDLQDADLIELLAQYKRIATESGEESLSALASYQAALLYYAVKDYSSATEYFQAAGNKDFLFTHQALIYLGHAFMNLAHQEQDSNKSLTHLQAAYALYEQVTKRFSKSPSVFLGFRYKALVQELLAKEYLELNNKTQAIAFFEKSKQEYTQYLDFMKQRKELFHFTDPYIMYMSQGQPIQQANVAVRRVDIALNQLKETQR